MPGVWLFTVSLKSSKIKFGSILFIYLQQLTADVRRKCFLSIKKNLPVNFLLLKRFWRRFCKLASLFFAGGGGGGWEEGMGEDGQGVGHANFPRFSLSVLILVTTHALVSGSQQVENFQGF